MAQLQEEVHLLRQMKDMLSKDMAETQGGCSANLLSATELRVQLSEKEQELERAKEVLQGQEPTQMPHGFFANPPQLLVFDNYISHGQQTLVCWRCVEASKSYINLKY